MADRPAAPIVESLGVTLDLEDGQHVVSLVVVGKVVDFDSEDARPALILGKSEGLDWIDQRGLVYAAVEVLQSDSGYQDER